MSAHQHGATHVVELLGGGLAAALHAVLLVVIVVLRVAFRVGLGKVAGAAVLVALAVRGVRRWVRVRRAARLAR